MKALLAILLSSIAALASAQSTPGYVTDSSGKVVKTGSDLCLRTSSWTSASAAEGCDPVAKPKVPVVAVIDAGVLFEFDSAALTPAGRAALDRLAANITAGSTVTVVGHTDRIGTAAYNLRLSQQRAGAVGDYLNAKSGFRSKFVTQGVGATQPTEGTKLCTGMRNFERFKSCLAPDRRVVITIIK